MKAKTMGSGWHKESLRHSQARRLGKAGGRYATTIVHPSSQLPKSYGYEVSYTKMPYGTKSKMRMTDYEYAENEREANEWKKTLEHDNKVDKSYPIQIKKLIRPAPYDLPNELRQHRTPKKFIKKDLTYKELKEQGVKLKPTADADKDGVPNSLDCRPLNKHAQDNGLEISVQTTEPKKGFWDKVKDFKAKRAERAEKAKAEEHEARMKEIARLKEEIKALEEKKEAQRLLAKEKNELEQIRQEHNRLKYEKIKAKAERVKKFLKPVGKFLKEEARYVVKGKTQRRTKKGRSRKMKPLLDFTI